MTLITLLSIRTGDICRCVTDCRWHLKKLDPF